MPTVKAPGLGPLIGATTDKTCRIWIRADAGGGTPPKNTRAIGIAGLVKADGAIGDAWYFRLDRENDLTGTINIGDYVALGHHAVDIDAEMRAHPDHNPIAAMTPVPLTPATRYVARLGTLTVPDPTSGARVVEDWELRGTLPPIDTIKQELLLLPRERSEAQFTTFGAPNTVAPRVSFLLGSCRYPGLSAFPRVKEADVIFSPMTRHFTTDQFGDRPRFSLMVGDQIYADRDNVLGPVEHRARYLESWNTFNFRQLVRSSTTYMILDDHEISDNWTMDKHPGNEALFTSATDNYKHYQWSHGPRNFGNEFYYNYICDGYPFFVLDTRTHRFKRGAGLESNDMLGPPDRHGNNPGQLERFLEWLVSQPRDLPKFVVSSSVFVPNPMFEALNPEIGSMDDPRVPNPPQYEDDDETRLYRANMLAREDSDCWAGFPNTRLAILKTIVEKKIQNVVFLCGDIHLPCIATMKFQGTAAAKKLKAFSITSSPFYWNLPESEPNSFVQDSEADIDPFPIVGTPCTMHYKAFGFSSRTDNFARIDIDKAAHTLTIRFFSSQGTALRVPDQAGNLTDRNVLDLAPW